MIASEKAVNLVGEIRSKHTLKSNVKNKIQPENNYNCKPDSGISSCQSNKNIGHSAITMLVLFVRVCVFIQVSYPSIKKKLLCI